MTNIFMVFQYLLAQLPTHKLNYYLSDYLISNIGSKLFTNIFCTFAEKSYLSFYQI